MFICLYVFAVYYTKSVPNLQMTDLARLRLTKCRALSHDVQRRAVYMAKILNPPSTTATVPVTNFEASDMR